MLFRQHPEGEGSSSVGERFLQDVIVTIYLTVSDLLRPLDFSSLALLDISFKVPGSVICGSSSHP